jgi:iron complex transport system substrate-binding protein
MKKTVISLLFLLVSLFTVCEKELKPSKNVPEISLSTITDHAGRNVTIPKKVERIVCSGAGCLRYICYLQGQDNVVAVDDVEKRKSNYNTRPYHIANPQFLTMPLSGEFRGRDNPELIVSLKKKPQVILKTYFESGYNPQHLQDKTGIPVVTCEYGDLTRYRDTLFASLRLMGKVIGKEKRADECITFFKNTIDDLRKRTASIPENKKVTCYIGGIAFRGPHGILSTEPGYAPFTIIGAKNVAFIPKDGIQQKRHGIIAKEKLIEWDPQILFIDLSTFQLADKTSAFYQLRHDPVYKNIRAVKNGNIYCVLPYNSYTTNHGMVLANAYYIGAILFQEQFKDIDPRKKADEIFSFLVGKPVFAKLNTMFQGKVYTKVDI